MHKRGLVIGKFYPPHKGHKHLIDTARANSEHVTVIVCANPSQSIAGEDRARWLRRIHPDVTVLLIDDSHMDDDDSEGWARETVRLLGFVPDAVFTSEDYGTPYAAFMGSEHVLVDKERRTVPISGTQVRQDPLGHLDFLEPPVRAHFVKRVVVLGAESTGTTTLAQALAEAYRTVWVPEYGRMYSEGKLTGDEHAAWRTDEFVHIAEEQRSLEDALAESTNRVLICDTDAFATGIWHERYLGVRSKEVEAVAGGRVPDLYLLTGDEIPFVQDGTRDGEHIRHGMHRRFIERLTEEGKRFVLIEGSREERLAAAMEAIRKEFSW